MEDRPKAPEGTFSDASSAQRPNRKKQQRGQLTKGGSGTTTKRTAALARPTKPQGNPEQHQESFPAQLHPLSQTTVAARKSIKSSSNPNGKTTNSMSKRKSGVDNDDEADIDRLAEDLVLHEGDGKIRRPIPLKLKKAVPKLMGPLASNNNTNNSVDHGGNIKPRRKGNGPTTTATASHGQHPPPPQPQAKVSPQNRRKSGMEEFLDRVRRTSGLAVDSDDESYDDSDADNHDDDDRSKPGSTITSNKRSSGNVVMALTSEDIEICQRLDDAYERALEEREVGYNARYASVRQSAFVSVLFLVLYMVQGTLVYMHQTEWSIPDSLFFSIFTITTVGYGKEDLPTTPEFQAYTIFYIMVGIAALTIMVAQVYQCIALEASRAQHSRDQTEMKRRGLDVLTTLPNSPPNGSNHSGENSVSDEIISDQQTNLPSTVDSLFRWMDRARSFFRNTELGRGISVIFPFAGLILAGALVVGPIEGWTFLEALYFAVVSLTTVGFGDYVPTELPSIVFCIFWLPCSVGFMSMYLGNVAAFYIRLSDKNIRRLERQLRRRLQKAKERAERERAEVLRRAYRGQEEEIEAVAAASDDGDDQQEQSTVSTIASSADAAAGVRHAIPIHHAKRLARRRKANQQGFDILPTSDLGTASDEEGELFGSSDADAGNQRRQRIIQNSRIAPGSGNSASESGAGDSNNHRTMKSMRDVIKAVRRRNNLDATGYNPSASETSSQFMSIRSTQTMTQNTMFRSVQTRKPSFALRVLIQERFAEIIAEEIAGFQSSIEIKDNTLSVTIDSVTATADKWSVPRRARKAFRSVAFEVLYFVGEHGLVTRGADALYDLTPFEFHSLFSSLVAAMGDADGMEQWLGSTDTLALVDLQRSQGDLDSSQGRHSSRLT